jgi:hypothetical protein
MARQQNVEFSCDIGTVLLLQTALAQHALQQRVAFNQARHEDARGQIMRQFIFQCCFLARREAVIDPDTGRNVRSAPSRRFSTGPSSISISPVSTTAASVPSNGRYPHLTTPERKGCGGSKRRHASESLHEAGRNTQIAAGSFDPARTATNSRSSSGTNGEVRARGTVGMPASRR